MGEITKETVEAYAGVARVVCHIPKTEPVVIFSVVGQRNQGCGRLCQGCPQHPECFPMTSPQQKAMWEHFLCQLLQGGEK